MRNGILFDLDGTLWDSTAAIVPAWNRVLGKWGKTLTRADRAGIMGLTDREIAARFLPDTPEAEGVAAVHAAAEEEAPGEDITASEPEESEWPTETLEEPSEEEPFEEELPEETPEADTEVAE